MSAGRVPICDPAVERQCCVLPVVLLMIDVAQHDYVAIKISEGIRYVLSFVLYNVMFIATISNESSTYSPVFLTGHL